VRVSATAKYLRGSTRKANLVIVEAHANEGPTLKRWKPRAQGRAFAIHKPMTHITIVLEEREA
jgi:large subunit ribosomal protein L22